MHRRRKGLPRRGKIRPQLTPGRNGTAVLVPDPSAVDQTEPLSYFFTPSPATNSRRNRPLRPIASCWGCPGFLTCGQLLRTTPGVSVLRLLFRVPTPGEGWRCIGVEVARGHLLQCRIWYRASCCPARLGTSAGCVRAVPCPCVYSLLLGIHMRPQGHCTPVLAAPRACCFGRRTGSWFGARCRAE